MQDANIRSLYSSYRADKDRVERKAEGTCEWFLTHYNFWTWREKQMSALLWVSGDPGCGKSVLSRHIVDHGQQLLRSSSEPATICYFFFKDGDSRRRSGASALCAVLHQLFDHNPALYSYAENDFRKKNTLFLQDFDALWDILTRAASDKDAGEIICVFDALDECEASERAKFVEKLVFYYSDDQVGKNRNSQLKSIVTSRPYADIEDKFHKLTEASSSIRLVGEAESDKISSEIDLVIEARIPGMTPKLKKEEQQFLMSHLKSMEHRTYLWLHLVFDLIRERYDSAIKKSSESTIRNLGRLLERLPGTVEEVYETMLDKSDNPGLARKLLRLIIGARRPLTLQEVNVILALDGSLDSSPNVLPDAGLDAAKLCTCQDELESCLDRESVLRGKIKSLCGLLVNISSDSKLYLVHQTVRDFLILEAAGGRPPARWRNSFDLAMSQSLLATACITYLMFSDFADPWTSSPIDISPRRRGEPASKEWDTFVGKHHFLDYAANHWPHHLREGEQPDKSLQQFFCSSLLQLCDISSNRFEIFYGASQNRLWRERKPNTSLYVAASLGLDLIVNILLQRSQLRDQDRQRYDYAIALFKASEGGYTRVVKVLLENNPILRTEAGSSLIVACSNGHNDVVNLLLDRNEAEVNISAKPKYREDYCDFDEESGGTPLICAARNGHTKVVRTLLRRGAIVDVVHDGGTALSLASRNGHTEVVQTLLDHNAEPNFCPSLGSPIACAADAGRIEVVELLLRYNADPKQDQEGNPLMIAVRDRNISLIQALLRKGAHVNCRTGQETALSVAAAGRDLRITQLLLDNGAEPNLVGGSNYYRIVQSPLQAAAYNGDFETIRLLLKHGADIDMVDGESLSALQWAIAGKQLETAQFLLNEGARPGTAGRLGSAFQIAAESGRLDLMQLLINNGVDLNASYARRSTEDPRLPCYDSSKDVQGTALQRAVRLNAMEAVRFLCEAGVDVNFRGDNASQASHIVGTPLQIALQHQFKDVAAFLLETKVEVDVRCLELACVAGFLDLLKSMSTKDPLLFEEHAGLVLKFSVECGHSNMFQWILQQFRIPKESENMAVALRLAAREGHVDFVRELLTLGADADVDGECPELQWLLDSSLGRYRGECPRESSGCITSLQVAAVKGHDEIVSMLARATVRIDLPSERGTALQLACYYGHSGTARLLIELGADVNADGVWRGSALQGAAGCGDLGAAWCIGGWDYGKREGYIELVRLLLDHSADVHAPAGVHGTALQRAARTDCIEIVQMLWRKGAHLDTPGGVQGTALQRAAGHGHLPIVKYLISKGADVNAPGGPFGTALQRAAGKGYEPVARELLKAGAVVDAGHHGSPLLRACAARDIATVKLLLAHGASVKAEEGYYWDSRYRSYPLDTHNEHSAFELCVEQELRKVHSLLNAVMQGLNHYGGNEHLPLLRLLVRSGASFQGPTAAEDWKIILKIATRANDLDFSGTLIDRAPAVEDKDLLPLVRSVSEEGRADMLQLLLRKVSDLASFQQLTYKADGWLGKLSGDQLLPVAAARGHVDVLRTLLDRGFNVNLGDETAFTPLEAAATNGAMRSLRILMERGAEVSGEYGCLALGGAAASGEIQIVQCLLQAGAVYTAAPLKKTPLVRAAKYGQENGVKVLLDLCGHSITEDDKQEAFEMAFSKGYYRVAYHLLPEALQAQSSLGDYIRKQTEREEQERDLIRASIRNSADDVLNLLESGVDINGNPNGIGTALQEASARGHLDLVETLLANGAKTELSGGFYDRDYLVGSGTALQRAAAGGYTEICKRLLAHNASFEPRAGSELSDSAIERAAERGHTDIVEYLLEKGASADSWTDHPHGTALQRAAAGGHLRMVALLLDHGANINSKAGSRGTALQVATTNRHIEVVRLLLRRTIDVDAVCPDSGTPLFIATQNHDIDAVKLLLANGANVNSRYLENEREWSSGMTPLHVAISGGSVELVRILLDAGADVTIRREHRDGEPLTAFQLAVKAGETDIVRLLASLEAVDINEPWKSWSRCRFAETPLKYAIRKQYSEIVEILRQHGAVESTADTVAMFPF